jgi:hypothetical protein
MLKGSESDVVLNAHDQGANLLKISLIRPLNYPKGSQIEACSLKYQYKGFAWLFAKIVGKDSTIVIPKYVLYILHYTFHENVIFYLTHVISNEVSFRLGNFHRRKKFYMTSYLIYASILPCV